jgi:hypothetical protein
MIAVRPSSVRAGVELSSEQLGILRAGETVTELERQEQAGQVRVRCERGWVSLASRDGTVLLRSAAADGEPAATTHAPAAVAAAPTAAPSTTAPSRSYADDLQKALLSLQGARRGGSGEAAQSSYARAAPSGLMDAESTVSGLIEQARTNRARSPLQQHGSPPRAVAAASAGSLHARALLDHARADRRTEQHAQAVVEQRAKQAARDAFAAARVPQKQVATAVDGPRTLVYAQEPREHSLYHTTRSVDGPSDPITQHDAGLSTAVQDAVEQERAAGEVAFRQQLMALRADAAAQLAQAHAAAQDATTEARIKHEAEMATVVQQTVDRTQQDAERTYRLRLEEAELRAKTEHDAELRRIRAGAAVDIEAGRQQAAADAKEECHVQYTAELSAVLQDAVEQERAAGEAACQEQLMALRADAAAQLAQAHAAAQDATTEARIKHEAEMATVVQQTVDRTQQDAERTYRLRLEEAELRAKTEHDAELRRIRAGAAVDIEAGRQQAAADAKEECHVQYTAELSAVLQDAVEQERAAGEAACAKLKEEAEDNLRVQLHAANSSAERKLKDALAAASLEAEASIESAVQATIARTKQAEESRHLSVLEEMQKASDTQRENAVSAALRESLAQAESDLEQERAKSRQARELATEQARLEATQAERQIAAARLAEAQNETSHHRLQAETLRVKLAQAEASSAARQEDAVRNAQEMARRELDTAISRATREHQAEMQRVAQQAQQARSELAREVDSVREVEKTRYDSQIAELERSIEGRMQQLHATARAHIEAEVAESLEQTWAELEQAGTMLSKAASQQVASSLAADADARYRQTAAPHAHDAQRAADTRGAYSRPRSRAATPVAQPHDVSAQQDPAYLRVRSRNMEAARSRARAQTAQTAKSHRDRAPQ